MQERTDSTWKDTETAKRFLKEMIGAIPFETEQLDIMMRLIAHQRETVTSFLDIGCGNGILSGVILNRYPQARGILLDFNDTMLSAAREKLSAYADRIKYIKSDYGNDSLEKTLSGYSEGVDVIVSRFSIHHQPDKRKKEVYQEIFNLLNPGGIFIHIEHVAPAGPLMKPVFEDYMIDHIYDYHRKTGGKKDRNDIAREFRVRHEKDTDIIASAEEQCAWLRAKGFSDVECYFKIFEIAIFGGRKTNKCEINRRFPELGDV